MVSFRPRPRDLTVRPAGGKQPYGQAATGATGAGRGVRRHRPRADGRVRGDATRSRCRRSGSTAGHQRRRQTGRGHGCLGRWHVQTQTETHHAFRRGLARRIGASFRRRAPWPELLAGGVAPRSAERAALGWRRPASASRKACHTDGVNEGRRRHQQEWRRPCTGSSQVRLAPQTNTAQRTGDVLQLFFAAHPLVPCALALGS
jgi:hypothetical protein